MDYKKEIKQITATYFDNEIDYEKLKKASTEYKKLLGIISETNLDIASGREDLFFNNGKALGTLWAAACIDDIMRTRQFIQGIDLAIKEIENTKETLHILYAGTGPYATLLLPIMLRYPATKVKYTFLEINPLTYNVLQKVVTKLKLDSYNITLVTDNATTYKIGNDVPDIILSETMQNALDKEQQATIFYNLMKQAKPETIFIPEKIKLSLGLKSKGIPIEKIDNELHYHRVDTVFELSKETMPLITEKSSGELVFSKHQSIITKEMQNDYDEIILITDIQIFKNTLLKINESGLTTPKTIKIISDKEKQTITFNSQYIERDVPRLAFEILKN